MIWDVSHHRGAGFPLHIMHPAGVLLILFSLLREPHLRPADLMGRLKAADTADAPLIGRRVLPERIGDTLGYLRRAGLIARCAGNGRGEHTRYDLTALGAGLVGALDPITAWAMDDWDFVVRATRVRLELPPPDGPIPADLRTERAATELAVGLLSGMWADTLMVYVDSAGPDGIRPQQLQETVNAAIDASTGESRVERHLVRDTMYATLKRLVAKGLMERHAEPPRVRYRLTPHGRGLMGAWWQVADQWSIAHDAELFQIMVRTSGWFPDAVPD